MAIAIIRDGAEYLRTLKCWAQSQRSSFVAEYRGPGRYEMDGYYDDECRPVATLTRI